jgi:hypothetical protein
MPHSVTIKLPDGRKPQIHLDTYHAIKRAVRIIRCDRRVAAYVAAPHEGITPDVVRSIRRRMIIAGTLPTRSYSRRHEQLDAN